MTIETGTTNRTSHKRLIVPTAEQIASLSDQALNALRDDLTEAKLAIENQIANAVALGDADPDWIVRSNGALTHMRRGLGHIKKERERRQLTPRMPDDLTPAFQAVDTVREVLKAHGILITAVRRFLDDDTDDNYNTLANLIDPEPA